MARQKWFNKMERQEAKAAAKEKGVYAWAYVRQVTPKSKDLKPFKDEGIYIGNQLPKELRKDTVKVKVIYEPKTTKGGSRR